MVANSVDPGIVTTEVLRHYSFILRWLFKFVGFFFFKVSKRTNVVLSNYGHSGDVWVCFYNALSSVLACVCV